MWRGVSGLTADALLVVPSSQEDRSALEDAKEFLRELLAGGPVRVRDIQRQARETMIAEKTLDRAKQALSVRAKKEGFRNGWQWYLAEGGQESAKVVIQKHDHLGGNLTTFAEMEVCEI